MLYTMNIDLLINVSLFAHHSAFDEVLSSATFQSVSGRYAAMVHKLVHCSMTAKNSFCLRFHDISADRRHSMPISDAISRCRENATTIRTFSCKVSMQLLICSFHSLHPFHCMNSLIFDCCKTVWKISYISTLIFGICIIRR